MNTQIIGLDVGGTKMSGILWNAHSGVQAEGEFSTPDNYENFLIMLEKLVLQLSEKASPETPVGLSILGQMNPDKSKILKAHSLPYLEGQPLIDDLSKLFSRKVRMANDANCAALAEAVDGAAAGYKNVFSLILGTGVGGSLVLGGQVCEGAQSLCGEIGHLPLPFRSKADAPLFPCVCGMDNCIEKAISGSGLQRLHERMTGQNAQAKEIAQMAKQGNEAALATLNVYFETVAKACVTIIHSFDPDIIVVSGGLSQIEGLVTEVPKRWGKYCIAHSPQTQIVLAKHGAKAGQRGAAFLWK